MNKSLVTKIALGLVIVAIPAFMFFNSKNKGAEQPPEISQEENQDASENLHGNTFEDTNNEEISQEENQEQNEGVDTGIIDDSVNNEENNQKPQDKPEEDKKEDSTTESKTVTAVFQGFADGNFIEMKIGDTYGVFKVSGDVKSKIESKNIGDTVTFTYVASGGQQIITSVN